MKHTIIEDLKSRYTTKKYDSSKRISEEDIGIIKEALRLTPSSVNSQPWKFIVIESDEGKQRFHDAFGDLYPNNQQHAKEASHIILFAHNPRFTMEDYKKVVDAEVSSGHLAAENYNEMLEKGMFFAGRNTDETGFNGGWTKAQTYLAFGNALHTVARLGIASTPLEGINSELISKVFEKELNGYVCEIALALGYHCEKEDYNNGLPKARLPMEDVIMVL